MMRTREQLSCHLLPPRHYAYSLLVQFRCATTQSCVVLLLFGEGSSFYIVRRRMERGRQHSAGGDGFEHSLLLFLKVLLFPLPGCLFPLSPLLSSSIFAPLKLCNWGIIGCFSSCYYFPRVEASLTSPMKHFSPQTQSANSHFVKSST